MKMLRPLIIYLILVISSTSIVFSQDKTKQVSRINDTDIEKTLLEGVKNDNTGLKISAAYYLGEKKSSKAVIPLMDVLHSDKSVEARIMAALSLFKIGDKRGIYAIKKAIKFDENEQVRKMCEIFYTMYQSELKEKEK